MKFEAKIENVSCYVQTNMSNAVSAFVDQQEHFERYLLDNELSVYGVFHIEELLDIINKCNWDEWFDCATNLRSHEYGGVLLFGKHGRVVNPVLYRGTNRSVDLPDSPSSNRENKLIRPIATIHTHPAGSEDDLEQLKPSIGDWAACKFLGLQLIVTKWGIYIHQLKVPSVDCMKLELSGNKWRELKVNATTDGKFLLYFIPKDKLYKIRVPSDFQ